MLDPSSLPATLGTAVVAAPAVLAAYFGVASLVGLRPSEGALHRAAQAAILVGTLALAGIFGWMLWTGERSVLVSMGDWVVVSPPVHGVDRPHGSDEEHYLFSVKFVFDRLSVPFAALSFVLCGTIGAFASRYLHREPGYRRFFLLYALFLLGMVLAGLAGTVETLFAGWELVGVSSALLVAFFLERPAPVRNGLRVWVVYRVSDAGLLLAAVVMHHLMRNGDFAHFSGADAWPEGHTAVGGWQALAVGSLLLLAAAGKSALLPFSGWLPRAMEGPTPSSAVFYGALSVHLGAYLLLRAGPLLEVSPLLAAAVLVLGLATAVFAAVTASVQTDIKSALSFASLTQVGLIVSEVGLAGLLGRGHSWVWYVPLVHLLGHACLRTLQFVRAPSILSDYRSLEDALGERLPRPAGGLARVVPAGLRKRLYRLALERGHLDAWLDDHVAGPFVRTFRWFDALERRWTDWLAGRPSRPSDGLVPPRTDEVP